MAEKRSCVVFTTCFVAVVKVTYGDSEYKKPRSVTEVLPCSTMEHSNVADLKVISSTFKVPIFARRLFGSYVSSNTSTGPTSSPALTDTLVNVLLRCPMQDTSAE